MAAKQATRNVLTTELTAITNFNILAEFSAILSKPNLHDNKYGVTQAASTELIAEGKKRFNQRTSRVELKPNNSEFKATNTFTTDISTNLRISRLINEIAGEMVFLNTEAFVQKHLAFSNLTPAIRCAPPNLQSTRNFIPKPPSVT
ncbi:hypothetical protein ACQKP8_26790, partial [Photobacterium alginatilyticum]|uniref:hypothetical protein n=1 Tax=Photobacterium alginatilyticum TaxID=1775171 RepID=UPI004067D1A8